MSEKPWVEPAYRWLKAKQTKGNDDDFLITWKIILSPLQRSVLADFADWQERDRGYDGSWCNALIRDHNFVEEHGEHTEKRIMHEREEALLALGYKWSGMNQRHREIFAEKQEILAAIKRTAQSPLAMKLRIMTGNVESFIEQVLPRSGELLHQGLYRPLLAVFLGLKSFDAHLEKPFSEFISVLEGVLTQSEPVPTQSDEERNISSHIEELYKLTEDILGHHRGPVREAITDFLGALIVHDSNKSGEILRKLIEVLTSPLEELDDPELLKALTFRIRRNSQILESHPANLAIKIRRKDEIAHMIAHHGAHLEEAELKLDPLEESIVQLQTNMEAGPPDYKDLAALQAHSVMIEELTKSMTERDRLLAIIAEWRAPIRESRGELLEIEREAEALTNEITEAESFFSELHGAIPGLASAPANGGTETNGHAPMHGETLVPIQQKIPEPLRSEINGHSAPQIFGYYYGFWSSVKKTLRADNATLLELFQEPNFILNIKEAIFRREIDPEKYSIIYAVYKTTWNLPIWKQSAFNALLYQENVLRNEQKTPRGRGRALTTTS